MKQIPPLALIALLLASLFPLRAADAPKPNLIVINIDDLGYADIEPFGSPLNRTPNLNRMASEGRRLRCTCLFAVAGGSDDGLLSEARAADSARTLSRQ